MDIFGVLIQTIGGLGLFILGMQMMTEGLQMSAGKRMKKILGAVSAKVLYFLSFVTEGIQSRKASSLVEQFMAQAIELENEIDVTREKMRDDHIRRLRCG